MPAKRPPLSQPRLAARFNRARLAHILGRFRRARLAHALSRFRRINWSPMAAAGLILFVAGIPGAARAALLQSIAAQPFVAGMLLAFGLLALSLLWSGGQRLDAWVFLYFNFRGRRPPWLDRAMLGFTQLGSGLAPILLAAWLFAASQPGLAYELLLGSLTLALTVELAKIIFRRSRPFVRLSQARIVGYRARGRSFPSGHTSQAFYLAALLLEHFHLGLGAAAGLYLLAALVAVTRMYIGAHYPRDVLAGAILGSVWGLLGVMMDVNFSLR
jgi:membrane-associated phospholipid phosphatase